MIGQKSRNQSQFVCLLTLVSSEMTKVPQFLNSELNYFGNYRLVLVTKETSSY